MMMLDILRQIDLNITSYKRRLCININSFESRLNIELARFLWLSLTCRRAQKKSLENKRKKSNFFIRIINLKNDFLLAAPIIKRAPSGAFFIAITTTHKVRLSRSRKPQYRLNYRTFYFFMSFLDLRCASGHQGIWSLRSTNFF